ncbi:class I SAM-dependent methyltransferase [Paenibacillus sp. UNC451MF]|uniref:class I SAM-dependent methyltransferase n=1 Tax=Paenibacillus sp. UNC451MF TaxID=1449063 RepID=UPI00048C1D7F|nr:class I SAM-dependent methyltransferase [Paenibacillus sp. UNC451MF]
MNSLFNKYYDRLMRPLESRAFHSIRKELIEQVDGTVLEVGSGTGVNFKYYQHADKVFAVEPDEMMLGQSLVHVDRLTVPIEVVRAGAEQLPFQDDSFDCVVCTLVFCTIPDPVTAWYEIKRVCKPGGRIFVFEHVRLNNPLWGTLQDWLTPWWKRCCGGCHLNRNTLDDIQRAGFNVTNIDRRYKGLILVAKAVNNK